jgi:uncharacterized membrane protein
MTFCPSCGAPVEGKFCAKCGTAVSGGGAGSPSAPPSTPSPSAPASSELAPNVASMLCYIPVLIPSIIFLVLAPYNRNKTIRFNAFQSLFMHIAWFIVWMALGIALPAVSWALWFGLRSLLQLAFLVLALFMMYKAYQNEKVVLPVVGPLAEKQA